MPSVKLIYGPQHRLLTHVTNLEGLRRVAAEKLACTPANVILAYREPDSDEYWDIEDAGTFDELAASKQAFHARVDEGRPPPPSPSSPARPAPVSATSLGSSRTNNASVAGPSRQATNTADTNRGRGTRSLEETPRRERSQSRRGRSRRRNEEANGSLDGDARADPRGAPPRNGRPGRNNSLLMDPEEEQVTQQLFTPAPNELSSRARWTEEDTNAFWRVFLAEVQSMPEPMPIYSREQTLALFRTIVARHGTTGAVSKVVAGRTANALESRARVLVNDARERGTSLSHRIFAVFPTSEEKKAARMQRARSISASSSASAGSTSRRSASRERPRRRDSTASATSRQSHRRHSDQPTRPNRSRIPAPSSSSSAHPQRVQGRKRNRAGAHVDAHSLSAPSDEDSESSSDGAEEVARRQAGRISRSTPHVASQNRRPPIVRPSAATRTPSNSHLINYNPFARYAATATSAQKSPAQASRPVTVAAILSETTSSSSRDEAPQRLLINRAPAHTTPSSSGMQGNIVSMEPATTDASPQLTSPVQEQDKGPETIVLKQEEVEEEWDPPAVQEKRDAEMPLTNAVEKDIDGEEMDELMADPGLSTTEIGQGATPATRDTEQGTEQRVARTADVLGANVGVEGANMLRQWEDRARKAIRRGLDDHLLEFKLEDHTIILPSEAWMRPFQVALQDCLPPPSRSENARRDSSSPTAQAMRSQYDHFVSAGFDEVMGCAFRGLDPSMSIRRASFAACRLALQLLEGVLAQQQQEQRPEVSNGAEDVFFRLVEAKFFGEDDFSLRPPPSRQPWPYLDVAAALCLASAGMADRYGLSLLDRIVAARRMRAAISSLAAPSSGLSTPVPLDKMHDFLLKLMASRQFLARCESMRRFIVEQRQVRQARVCAKLGTSVVASAAPTVRVRKEVLDLVQEALKDEERTMMQQAEQQQPPSDVSANRTKLEAVSRALQGWNSAGELVM